MMRMVMMIFIKMIVMVMVMVVMAVMMMTTMMMLLMMMVIDNGAATAWPLLVPGLLLLRHEDQACGRLRSFKVCLHGRRACNMQTRWTARVCDWMCQFPFNLVFRQESLSYHHHPSSLKTPDECLTSLHAPLPAPVCSKPKLETNRKPPSQVSRPAMLLVYGVGNGLQCPRPLLTDLGFRV